MDPKLISIIGAVIAVIPLFHKRFHQFIFNWREKATQDYLLKILVAFVITGAIGFVLDKKGLKLPEQLMPVAIAVLAGNTRSAARATRETRAPMMISFITASPLPNSRRHKIKTCSRYRGLSREVMRSIPRHSVR